MNPFGSLDRIRLAEPALHFYYVIYNQSSDFPFLDFVTGKFKFFLNGFLFTFFNSNYKKKINNNLNINLLLCKKIFLFDYIRFFIVLAPLQLGRQIHFWRHWSQRNTNERRGVESVDDGIESALRLEKALRTQSSIIVPLIKKKRVIVAWVIRIGIFRDINERLKEPTSVSLLFIVWEIDAQNDSSLQFFHFEMQTGHIPVIFFQLIELQAEDPKLAMLGKLPWREYFYRLSRYILLKKEITKIFHRE